MTTALSIPRSVIGLATLSLIALPGELVSQDDAALREERRNAKKERQELRSDRREEIRDAQRELREYARDLEREYRERLREMDVAFQLRRTDLDAERKSKLAEAQSEIQAKMTSLYMQPGGAQEERGQTVQEEIKKLKDKTFAIEKESAEKAHGEEMKHEREKNELLAERDDRILEKAEKLGLTRAYEPILATPIGGELTDQEERWNDRQRREVEKLAESNDRLLREYRNGRELRAWELENAQEDFQLDWEEKMKLQEIQAKSPDPQMMFAQGSGQSSGEAYMQKLAELQKQREQIEIEYDRIRERNRIARREERRALREQ